MTTKTGSTNNLTAERQRYHQFLNLIKVLMWPGAIVYDIGKSIAHDYVGQFAAQKYKTIDRDPDKTPDIVLNIEGLCCPEEYVDLCHFVLCNGVVEQCDNPYDLLAGVNAILKPGGFALLGIISVGYPIYSMDRVRFTPSGARYLVERYGFKIENEDVVERDGVPSYVFMICKKIKA